jgi:hypothetical protein
MQPWEYELDLTQAPHGEKVKIIQETELEIGLVVSDINTTIMCTLSPQEADTLARRLSKAAIPSVV